MRRVVQQIHEVGVGAQVAVERRPGRPASPRSCSAWARWARSSTSMRLPHGGGALAQRLQPASAHRRSRPRCSRGPCAMMPRTGSTTSALVRVEEARARRHSARPPAHCRTAALRPGQRRVVDRRRACRPARAAGSIARAEGGFGDSASPKNSQRRRHAEAEASGGKGCVASGSRASRGPPHRSPSPPAARARPRATVRAKIDTQSTLCAAGTTPRALIRPCEGLSPTMLLSPAGTRPEPAVSVPSAKSTWPLATTYAEPELDPPDT